MSGNKYPDCAGQGQSRKDGSGGHCGKSDCPVCTTFGFAKGNSGSGGFAGLAGFSDMYVLLFPVATREGPLWVTAPSALRQITGLKDSIKSLPDNNSVYRILRDNNDPINLGNNDPINLGWLLLPVKTDWQSMNSVVTELKKMKIPEYIDNSITVVSDKLFSHIINSNLEVRTSVAIDPATGSAEDGALFTYEALPRGTILRWTVICRNPSHFKIDQEKIKISTTPEEVYKNVKTAFPYLEHLGIGGMANRGMGRLLVLNDATLENID
ncbi:CRISPR-associated RAMP Cmr4 [Methanosarcina siciliae C2J]|uniref:CRISPR-associated RAMP Cmr4 n=2 Tax=Methanosarcina siciliae TaxID=38027 RepID=A0A0E3PNW0_9EURY|nr:CRISPR-associated RAMP Cmr4 [Methanosarcina siciliae C2J]